jgi:hypothetical protein
MIASENHSINENAVEIRPQMNQCFTRRTRLEDIQRSFDDGNCILSRAVANVLKGKLCCAGHLNASGTSGEETSPI